VGAVDDVCDLANLRCLARCYLAETDADRRRRGQVLSNQVLDARRHRRTEQDGLACRGGPVENRLDVLGKAHVQHFVRLIENDNLKVREIESPTREMVDRPSRRGNDNVDATLQRFDLADDRSTAVDRQNSGADVASVLVDRFGDLDRQFTRRDEDERAGTPPAERDALQQR
jgi:hypothetical protein